MKLNLGAGSRILDGYVNVDQAGLDGIDVQLDLDAYGPWPWPAGSVERIEADNVFEHVHRPIHFMVQCHRVLKDGGFLHLRTPHMSSPDSWTDPTHVRHCTEQSFDFWVPGNIHYEVNNAAYGGVAFSRRRLSLAGGMIDITLAKIA